MYCDSITIWHFCCISHTLNNYQHLTGAGFVWMFLTHRSTFPTSGWLFVFIFTNIWRYSPFPFPCHASMLQRDHEILSKVFYMRAARDLCSHSACVCVLRLQSVIIPFCPSLCLPLRFFLLFVSITLRRWWGPLFPGNIWCLPFLSCVCVCFVCASLCACVERKKIKERMVYSIT